MNAATNLRSENGGLLATDNPVIFDARGKEYRSTITAFEKEKLITLESKQGPITARYSYKITSSATGCDLIISIELQTSGFAKLIKPLLAFVVWNTDKDQGERIKSAVGAGT